MKRKSSEIKTREGNYGRTIGRQIEYRGNIGGFDLGGEFIGGGEPFEAADAERRLHLIHGRSGGRGFGGAKQTGDDGRN